MKKEKGMSHYARRLLFTLTIAAAVVAIAAVSNVGLPWQAAVALTAAPITFYFFLGAAYKVDCWIEAGRKLDEEEADDAALDEVFGGKFVRCARGGWHKRGHGTCSLGGFHPAIEEE